VFLVNVVILSSLLECPTILAEDLDSADAVSFEADSDPTLPVDPIDPTIPVEPVEPTQPGTAGPLSIDFASHFQFGAQKIVTTTKTYYALLQKFKDGSEGPNYVQVTDKRGVQEGWTLSVTQGGQFKTQENETLNGATLSFVNAAMASTMADAYQPTAVTEYIFIPNQEKIVMNASVGRGMGTWIYKFGKDNTEGQTAIRLSVPGQSVKLAKKYLTTLTWSIKAVP
jgi:hypothetical protein